MKLVDLSVRLRITIGHVLPFGHHDIPHSDIRSRVWWFRALATRPRDGYYAEWRRFPRPGEGPDMQFDDDASPRHAAPRG